MPSISFAVVTGLVATVVACWIFKLLHRSWEQRSIRWFLRGNWPSMPSHWFWGHLHMISLDNPEIVINYMKKASRTFSHGSVICLGPVLAAVRVFHQSIFKVILGGPEHKFPKAETQYRYLYPWLGRKGLLILKGNEWLRHRRLLTNSFHLGVLKSYSLKLNECSKLLVDKWHRRIGKNGQASIEIFHDVSLLTLDSILRCLVGVDMTCQLGDSDHQDYVDSIHDISHLVTSRFRSKNMLLRSDWIYGLTKGGREFKKRCACARDYSETLIKKRRQEYANTSFYDGDVGGEGIVRDFLDILLQAKDSHGNHLTDVEVSDEVNTFVFAGHDTTSSAISWACYCLASNPVHQQKCQREIDKILGDREDLKWEDLLKLEYLTLCIKETMRMFPPVPSVARQAAADVDFEGRGVRQGTLIIMSFLGLHFNPRIWPDSETFDPLRFTPENCSKRDPYAYAPFSAGPRNCIGQNFAMSEIKICVAHILHNFVLAVDESRPCVQSIEIIYRTKAGLHLLLTPRRTDVP